MEVAEKSPRSQDAPPGSLPPRDGSHSTYGSEPDEPYDYTHLIEVPASDRQFDCAVEVFSRFSDIFDQMRKGIAPKEFGRPTAENAARVLNQIREQVVTEWNASEGRGKVSCSEGNLLFVGTMIKHDDRESQEFNDPNKFTEHENALAAVINLTLAAEAKNSPPPQDTEPPQET